MFSILHHYVYSLLLRSIHVTQTKVVLIVICCIFFFYLTMYLFFLFSNVLQNKSSWPFAPMYRFNLQMSRLKLINQKFCDKSLYRCTLFACIIIILFFFFFYINYLFSLLFVCYLHAYLLPALNTIRLRLFFHRFDSMHFLSAASTIYIFNFFFFFSVTTVAIIHVVLL